MRIALVAPLYNPVPPIGYGGTERILQHLIDEFIKLGHTVTLYTVGGSKTPAHQIETMPCGLGDYGLKLVLKDGQLEETPVEPFYSAQLYAVLSNIGDYDVVHIHHETYFVHGRLFKALLDEIRRVPIVWTDHMTLQFNNKYKIFEDLALKNVRFTTLSNSQRDLEPRSPWIATVYNGIPKDLCYPTGVEPTYLAFLGRCSPEKGAEFAIRIALAAGMPLKLAGPLAGFHMDYAEELGSLIRKHNFSHIDMIDDIEKPHFLSGAKVLLFPIQWEEPFGLVMIEAMACGTPTIAFRRGSVPEVIDDGVTGFIVDTEAEAVEKLKEVGKLDRKRIREVFEQRFTSRIMAEGYLRVYEQLCGQKRVMSRGKRRLRRYWRRLQRPGGRGLGSFRVLSGRGCDGRCDVSGRGQWGPSIGALVYSRLAFGTSRDKGTFTYVVPWAEIRI